MIRFAALLALASAVASIGVCESHADPSGTWLPLELHWRAAPRSVDRDLKSAQAEILYFYKDGRFALVDCTLYKRRTGITVSKGDAQGVYAGTWHADGEDVKVKYRLTYRTIEIVGGPPQNRDFDASLKLLNDQTLSFRGKVFQRDHRVDASVEEDVGAFMASQASGTEPEFRN